VKKSFIIIILWIVFALFTPIQAQQLLINEFMSSNALTILDDDGEDSDWIELYNSGTVALNLSGFGLSNNATEPFKWVFPQLTLQPGEYSLVWASGKNRTNPSKPLHTNFSLSSLGEDLILSKPSGEIMDQVAGVALQTDISYGRDPQATENWVFYTEPSPGEPNPLQGYLILLEKPQFSHNAGYYTDSIVLNISESTPASEIRFTTNGSVPSQSDPVFSNPIVLKSLLGEANTISMIPTNNNEDPGPPYYEGWQPPLGEVYKAHVIRARAFHPEAPPGPVVTGTYFVEPLANQRFSLPVFSLTTNPENLFDDEIGIYVHGNNTNYFQDGDEWERAAHLELFENDGNQAFAENIGIRTHGNTTRSRPRKSLRIVMRKEYGNSWLEYPIFPDKGIAQYKRFILRNSGNDWDWAVFRDALSQSLASGFDVDRQFYRPAILMINGEYWGIHNTRDRYDEHYIFSNYGIEEHEMTILENNALYKFGNEAGRAHYVSMTNYMNSYNLASDEHYAEISTRMDVESFTDFQITHIFSMNTDWPGNNTLMWRYIRDGYDPNALNGRDGRWRWMLLDLDFGFGLPFFYVPGVEQGAAHNTLAFALATNGPSWPNPPWSTFILRNLVKNQSFKYFFINRFADMLNTTLSEDNVIHTIDSITNLLNPEMEEHIRRWRRPTSKNEWIQNIENMRSFAAERPGYLRQYINQYFQAGGQAILKLSVETPEMGFVRLNTIEIAGHDEWEGLYFRNVPVKLRAVAYPGYRFVQWQGDAQESSESIEVTLTTNKHIKALFEPSNDFPGDSMNPVAYRLSNGPYVFSYWDPGHAEGEFPPNMVFQQSTKNDPRINDEMTHPYHIPTGEYHSDDAGSIGFPYKLTRRTRLNGLGEQGISLINTGRGRDLGTAVLAVDTREMSDVTVSWKAGTLIPNSRVYRIRLQYRTSLGEAFSDVTDSFGQSVEYVRNTQAGHEESFGPVVLPSGVNNQAYVQFRWKYYFTGEQLDQDDGSRDMLRLDDIVVSTVTMNTPDVSSGKAENMSVYPNPASGTMHISATLAAKGDAVITVINQQGLKVLQRNLQLSDSLFYHTEDVSQWKPGLYIVSISTLSGHIIHKVMITHE
jgi:hypothetical protein